MSKKRNYVKKIYCQNKHLIGIVENEKLIIKKAGREVVIHKAEYGSIKVNIKCDRCKQEINVFF